MAASPHSLSRVATLLEAKALRFVFNHFESRPPTSKPSLEHIVHTSHGPTRILIFFPQGYSKDCPVPYPVHLDFHGGGFIFGYPEHDSLACRLISDHTSCVVVTVDYLKAPENPFPQGLEQCFDVLMWLSSSDDNGGVRMLNIDPERVSVGGFSAGANLAAAICLMAVQRQKQRVNVDSGNSDSTPSSSTTSAHTSAPQLRIIKQLLCYPVLDLATPYAQKLARTKEPTKSIPQGLVDLYVHCYLPVEEDRSNPLASPYYAKLDDLRNLPPAVILTADWDAMADEADTYAQRLESAGVSVCHKRFEKTVHGWTHFAQGKQEPKQEAWRTLCDNLREAYEGIRGVIAGSSWEVTQPWMGTSQLI
ncbi:hypothetical protein BZG36_02964 [Bifiguratus adelaidae]|uniref:Alpha/beta hydrolase fold-3 domain-containing protein n=1 Tax=Bifiguratus adelaidae TaxID=1938954 RepID=A0A261Y0S3_9FUNG|nr:hypothetical protein BZG36_02964 [Bifiguratus adelaidae]